MVQIEIIISSDSKFSGPYDLLPLLDIPGNH